MDIDDVIDRPDIDSAILGVWMQQFITKCIELIISIILLQNKHREKFLILQKKIEKNILEYTYSWKEDFIV